MALDKSAFEEAVSNMALQASPYFNEYVFYMHLLSQCHVIFSTSLPAPAGVYFNKSHYVLCINPSEVVGKVKDDKGNEKEIPGFHTNLPLKHRIGILKHEMLHIALGHIVRGEGKNHTKYNYASDCALNQQIDRDHLPDGCIYPDNLPTKCNKVLDNETAEYYYDLLDDDQMPQDEQGQGFAPGEGGDSEDTGQGNQLGTGHISPGDHGMWNKSEGDEELQKEITKNMVEKSASQTQKSKGTLPSNYGQMIENLSVKREVDWKRVLRTIVGNKRANTRKTLLRRDRRLPTANWIKGKTKDRIFDLAVVSDVSGSVSDTELVGLWGEIIGICDTYKVPVTMVQIDASPSPPQQLDKNVKVMERKSRGGTYLSPALEEFRKAKINYNALVVTTDGYLFGDDINPFMELKVPVIWLISPDGQIMDEMNTGRMRAIKLSKD